MPELVVHLNKSNLFVNTWYTVIIFYCTTVPSGPEPPNYQYFMITLRHTTLETVPMDEWSAQHRDLYLTTLTTDKQPSTPVGFKPAIPTSKELQTHTFHQAATGTTPHPSYAAVIWQMVKHDQKYTKSYHTMKSRYSKTQTSYLDARLHIKIIHNMFPVKHSDLHTKNKCVFCWFTLHNHNAWYKKT